MLILCVCDAFNQNTFTNSNPKKTCDECKRLHAKHWCHDHMQEYNTLTILSITLCLCSTFIHTFLRRMSQKHDVSLACVSGRFQNFPLRWLFPQQALMYQDPARWGITLQTYVQLTMLANHLSSTVSALLHTPCVCCCVAAIVVYSNSTCCLFTVKLI